ncbi:uncharacterized protein CDAR_526111 [Caerostris darwini]|uniref:Gustatory receptor n=1 Tax=Caerostris darwini TaxID=1538125 RepID=A0AAV4UHL3_9ARAC|nr:uncharacterized protein CDAR_526111 [Caerostris darwini]
MRKKRCDLHKIKIPDKSLSENFKIYPQLILKEKSTSKNHYNPLSPFLKSLLVFGLYISDYDGTHRRCRRILRFIHLAIVFGSLHYWVVLYLSYFARNEGSWKIFNQTLVIVTSTATFDLVLIRRKEIKTFFRYFSFDKAVPLCKIQKRKYLKRTRIFNVVVWIYALLWVGTFLIIPTKKIPEQHFTEFFYHHVVNKTSYRFGKSLIQINDAYLCLLTEGALSFIVGFYITAVCGSSLWFKILGENVKEFGGSRVLNPLDLNKLQRMYDLLISRINLLDQAFSLSVLLWYFMVTLTLCIRVIAIIADESKSDIQGLLIIGFGLFRGTFMILIGIAFCAQYLTDTGNEGVLKIEMLAVTAKDTAAFQELTILLRMLELKPPVVTLWKFCAIGKPFLMSCVQTMVTYVIICLQMTPAGKTLLHI